MKLVVALIVAVLFSFATERLAAQVNPAPADVLFLHGNIYTVNDKQPKAEAIAATHGKIIFVGSDADAEKHRGRATQIIDFGGKTVVPGLTDSHCHLSGVGAREVSLNLEGTTSLQDFFVKVKARVDQAKPDEWITGRGWIETSWTPPSFPTRDDLDRIAPHNPVWLTRADGHGAVANSAAIQLAGVTRDTPNPFGGEIMRNRETGESNGMFLDNAKDLIAKHIPPRSPAENILDLERGAKRNQALGWTSLHVPSSSRRKLEALGQLYQENRIKLRIDLALLGPSDDAQWLLKHGPTIGAFDQRLTCRAIKVSFDGALGSKGAALLEKYSDYDTSGFLKWTDDDLLPMFDEASAKAFKCGPMPSATAPTMRFFAFTKRQCATCRRISAPSKNRAGEWSTPKSSPFQTFRDLPHWELSPRCSRRTPSAICTLPRAGWASNGWKGPTPGKVSSKRVRSFPAVPTPRSSAANR